MIVNFNNTAQSAAINVNGFAPTRGEAWVMLGLFAAQLAESGLAELGHLSEQQSAQARIGVGIVFLIGQMYDYATLGFGLSDTMFGTTFYTLTGFHGAHVAGGAAFILIVLLRARSGQFTARYHDTVEMASYYWHFVDVVWLGLFSTIYLLQ